MEDNSTSVATSCFTPHGMQFEATKLPTSTPRQKEASTLPKIPAGMGVGSFACFNNFRVLFSLNSLASKSVVSLPVPALCDRLKVSSYWSSLKELVTRAQALGPWHES